jgi:hypothetical protein
MITKKELLSKYPKIFKNATQPKSVSCMAQGLSVPDRWLPILDQLCNSMQNDGRFPQVVADQVKSKFNHLRFYFHLEWEGESEYMTRYALGRTEYALYAKYYAGMVDMAASMIYNLEN